MASWLEDCLGKLRALVVRNSNAANSLLSRGHHGFKYRHQNFDIAGHSIVLRLLTDLDFDGSVKTGISEDAFPLFGVVWASSEVLAEYLVEIELPDRGAYGIEILEIGCGMALASHALNLKGESVTAMDIHPLAGDLLQINTELNHTATIPFHNASWSDPDVALGKFDLIVGGDILYEPKHVEHLADFIDRHLNVDGRVVIVDPERGQLERFLEDMTALKFNIERDHPDFRDHLDIPFNGSMLRLTRDS